jgi:hypothetical protein
LYSFPSFSSIQIWLIFSLSTSHGYFHSLLSVTILLIFFFPKDKAKYFSFQKVLKHFKMASWAKLNNLSQRKCRTVF